MRVVLDRDKLLRGLQVRGMRMADLAVAAGVSPPTVSAALAGRAVNLRSAIALTRAIGSRPVLPEMDDFLPDAGISPLLAADLGSRSA